MYPYYKTMVIDGGWLWLTVIGSGWSWLTVIGFGLNVIDGD